MGGEGVEGATQGGGAGGPLNDGDGNGSGNGDGSGKLSSNRRWNSDDPRNSNQAQDRRETGLLPLHITGGFGGGLKGGPKGGLGGGAGGGAGGSVGDSPPLSEYERQRYEGDGRVHDAPFQCTACTFVNYSGPVCEICGTSRRISGEV